MTRQRTVTDLALERYRLGELPKAEAAILEGRIDADPALRERLLELERSDEELLRDHPVADFVDAVKSRAAVAPRRTWFGRPLRMLAPAAVLAASWIAVSLRLPVGDSQSSMSWQGADGTSFSIRPEDGGLALFAFAKRGDHSMEQLTSGALIRPGDVVQLAYRGGDRRYGVILSIDGKGQVTRYFPVTGDAAAPLQHDGITPLDVAYRPDAAPRGARFYFIAADAPFPVGQAVAVAQARGLDPLALDRLPLDPPFVQTSFLIRKE